VLDSPEAENGGFGFEVGIRKERINDVCGSK
jgi:hypothetical protein